MDTLDSNTFKIYNEINQLPKEWDTVAHENVFLQTQYLQVLEKAAPTNMQCFYIGIFENKILTGVALAQYLNLNKLESFGDRDPCLKTYIRNFIFKNFASHALFLGNNMITGQNGYLLSKNMDFKCISNLLLDCAKEITKYFKEKNIQIHIVSFKDFYQDCAVELKKNGFYSLYEFNTQPNMILELSKNWESINNYSSQLLKKYRDQFKRAKKKFEGIEVKELTLNDIIKQEDRIYELYHHVAKNAPFNTFFLSKNHFTAFKESCGNRFVIFGLFDNSQMVGFFTLLPNGKNLETYFLGYDAALQKEKMLYLNMLYLITEYGIENGFKKIIFGRTALEIKSSIGAKPVIMSGFLYHNNTFINKFIHYIFPKLEPRLEWQQRHPFKN